MLSDKQLFSNRQNLIFGSCLCLLFHPGFALCNWTAFRILYSLFLLQGQSVFWPKCGHRKENFWKDYQVLETFQTWTMRTIILQQVKQSDRWEAVVPSGICTLPLDAPPPCFLSSKEYVTGSSVHAPELPLENVATFTVLYTIFPFPYPTKSTGSYLPIKPLVMGIISLS